MGRMRRGKRRCWLIGNVLGDVRSPLATDGRHRCCDVRCFINDEKRHRNENDHLWVDCGWCATLPHSAVSNERQRRALSLAFVGLCSDTVCPVQSNEFLHLLKNVFCLVIRSFRSRRNFQSGIKIINCFQWNDFNAIRTFDRRISFLSPVWSLEGNEGDSLFLSVVFRLLLDICSNVLVVVVCRLFRFRFLVHRQLAFAVVLDAFGSFLHQASRQGHLQSIGTFLNNTDEEEVRWSQQVLWPNVLFRRDSSTLKSTPESTENAHPLVTSN